LRRWPSSGLPLPAAELDPFGAEISLRINWNESPASALDLEFAFEWHSECKCVAAASLFARAVTLHI
jgi:hypothetical protein